MRFVYWAIAAGMAGAAIGSVAGYAAGDLSRQTPIDVIVDLGKPGQHVFEPKQLKFETGKLYKLILRNNSDDPRYILICDVWSPRLSPEERTAIAGVIAATDAFNGTTPAAHV